MKRVLATFLSCFVLLSATVSVPALAEAKDEAQQSDVSTFQDVLAAAADGIQSVLDGAKTNIAELLDANEALALEDNVNADATETALSQDVESAALIPSNIDGVVWDADYTTCTLQYGASVDGQDLKAELHSHLTTITTFIAEANTSMTGSADELFYRLEDLSTVDFGASFDTSQVNSMVEMFYECSSLTSITFSNTFNTGNVEDMNQMFVECSALTSLTLPDAFDTGNVQDMTGMFYGCSALTSLALPDAFDTCSVENMYGMFFDCSALKSLTLPNAFDSIAAKYMDSMFFGCTQLESINMSMSSSEKLISCVAMFGNCDNLKELNLGNFVPPAGQASLGMFADVDVDSLTGDISGCIPNIEKITMSGACILEPGEGTSPDAASGTFFDYKEPLSWSAYYLGNAATGNMSAQSAQSNLFAEPTAVLTGFDEFKAYQETHPGLTTYIFDEKPTPPDPTPDPTPEPTPDVMPASDADVLPVTGDTFAALASAGVAVLMGTVALLASGYSLTRKRLQ